MPLERLNSLTNRRRPDSHHNQSSTPSQSSGDEENTTTTTATTTTTIIRIQNLNEDRENTPPAGIRTVPSSPPPSYSTTADGSARRHALDLPEHVTLSLILPLPVPVISHRNTFVCITRITNFYQFRNIMEQPLIRLDDYFHTALRAMTIARPGLEPCPPAVFVSDPYRQYTYLEIYGHFNFRHINQVIKNYFKAFVQCQRCASCCTLIARKRGKLRLLCLTCQFQVVVNKRMGTIAATATTSGGLPDVVVE
ncbi:uncharacterized protein LOC129602211 [Paramacrobiotus metropolitanus]|uniref:uncharacterized protein LOC129602211 n=1 Tax=Paramacrobiotus metropolitanus TaxID=2943436 RepID=UPI002446486A|nr:uncharacterized protein LOC129602211 [Paramacrobiotus metropolitanus]